MRFELKVSRHGEPVSVVSIDAANLQQAEQEATKLGYITLGIKKSSDLNLSLNSRKTQFNLLLFSQELHALLQAGLVLVESIETLTEKNPDSETRNILTQISNRLYEGRTFSKALEDFPHIFPALFVAMVRSSENTGNLSNILARYIAYRTQLEQIRKKVVTASIYPALLLSVGGLVTLFLLGYVVPKFSSVYGDSKVELPWMSKLLIQWGQLLHAYPVATLIVFLAMVVTILYLFSLAKVRVKLYELLCRMPAIGKELHLYQLARFYRTLGLLLQGGISLVPAMQMSSDLLSYKLKPNLLNAVQQVKEGQPLSRALDEQGLTTPVSLRMIRVGERSGEMGEMIERAAVFYDDEIARTVEFATRLFEPVLMAIIGIVIGVIVVLMYMPIFDLADAIQ